MRAFSTKKTLRQQIQEQAEELEETRELLQQILNTLPDIVYIFDLSDMGVVYVSNLVRSFGYTPQDIYGLGKAVFSNLIHPDDYDQVLLTVDEMLSFKDNEVRENKFRAKASNGDWKWVYSRTVLFKNGADGKPIQVLGIIQDITSNAEVEKAYQEEKARNQELARINALLDLFVHSAAHDLRGPTGNLLLLAELVREANRKKKLELCDKIEPIVKSLNRTVASLLDIVYLEREAGKSIKQLTFQDVYDHVIAEFSDEIQKADPVITLDFSKCPRISYIDSFVMSVFRNLLSNSLKYRSDQRRLTIDIASECHGKIVVLQITDNGIGLNPQFLDDLFKPFKRFNSKTEGSGIGLYLINTMVARNGGKIEMSSKPNEGTTFRVNLVEY